MNHLILNDDTNSIGQNLFPYLITSVFTNCSSYLPSQWSFAPGPFAQKSLQKLRSIFQVYVIQKNGKESVKKRLHPYLPA